MHKPSTDHTRESLVNDSESGNTWTDNLRETHVIDNSAGLRRRIHAPVRLVLTPAIVSRFLSKVKQGGPDECWLWTASTSGGHGYGQFAAGRDSNGRFDVRYAHRVAFQLATGIDPVGAVVMHSCDTPTCCNPAHLSLGTQAQNVADASRKGRYLRGLTIGSRRWQREQRRKKAA